MSPLPDPMLRAIVDHIADQWFLRRDKREEFRAALLAELTGKSPRELHVGAAVGRTRVSKALVDASRAVGVRRKWFGLPDTYDFNPETVFREPVGLRIYRFKAKVPGAKRHAHDRVTVRKRSGGGKPVRYLELWPARDPELR